MSFKEFILAFGDMLYKISACLVKLILTVVVLHYLSQVGLNPENFEKLKWIFLVTSMIWAAYPSIRIFLSVSKNKKGGI